MCNAVSTSEWQQKRHITYWKDRSGVGRPNEAILDDPRRLTGIKTTYSDVHWISHLAQPLDSPLCFTDFHIVTDCICVCSFRFYCHTSFLLFVGFSAPSVLLRNLLFFYCCESGWYLICWKKMFRGFCLTTQIYFSLWKGLAKRSARI